MRQCLIRLHQKFVSVLLEITSFLNVDIWLYIAESTGFECKIFDSERYRIFPGKRRGFCPYRMTSNN